MSASERPGFQPRLVHRKEGTMVWKREGTGRITGLAEGESKRDLPQ